MSQDEQDAHLAQLEQTAETTNAIKTGLEQKVEIYTADNKLVFNFGKENLPAGIKLLKSESESHSLLITLKHYAPGNCSLEFHLPSNEGIKFHIEAKLRPGYIKEIIAWASIGAKITLEFVGSDETLTITSDVQVFYDDQQESVKA